MEAIKSMSTYSEEISSFVSELKYKDIPKEVIYKAKLHLLDTLGVAISFSRNSIIKDTVVKTVKELNTNSESTVINSKLSSSSDYAALANASMIHGQDYDDTHRPGVVHSSSIVVPAALACGEAREISGESLIETMVSGYEILARIGMAANEGFHKKGMHATPMCGVFVASLIAGKVNGLSNKELVNALGVCGSQAAGLQQFLIDGSWAKIIHPGWAVHSGIIASKLASNGFTGPLAIFEGELGFFAAHLGLKNVKLNFLTKDLRKVWQTLNISMKYYPCCHAIHSFIDGVFFLQKKYNIQWQNIKKIICVINPLGAKLVCEPIEVKRTPKTIYGARFSLPYTIAMSLLDGELGLKQFSKERISDNQVFEITKKVVCINEDSFPRTGGNITIEMEDGNKYHYLKEHPIGSPLYPLGEHQVLDKFRRNVSDIIPKNRAEQIIKSVLNIESIDNIKKLMTLLK